MSLLSLLDGFDAAFSWSKEESSETKFERYRLNSQLWKGGIWSHSLWRVNPKTTIHPKWAVLYVTGDEVGSADFPIVERIANQTGLPTFALFDVPNQPLWEFREDDLIAHTFKQVAETGEPDWVLLLPMVKSVLGAIEAISQMTGIERFVLVGGSKRAWTIWLAAATKDSRIKGIVPMVFDHLNMEAQLKAQVDYWGDYSPKLDDYTKRQLQAMMGTPGGEALIDLVDPYRYLHHIRQPKLIITGGNDEFWTVDALSRYYRDLWGDSYCITVPNAGHSLGDFSWAATGIGIFARSLVLNKKLPQHEFKIEGRSLEFAAPGADRLRIWIAESPSRQFSDKTWEVKTAMRTAGIGSKLVERLPESDHYRAIFGEAEFKAGEGSYHLTSLVHIIDPA